MNATSVPSKSHLSELDDLRTEKIRAFHRERLAVVYVRQSTVQQVLDHQESTRLQYGLVSRAEALGWTIERVLVIDDDLGKSGASAQNTSWVPTTGLRSEPESRRDHLRRGDVTVGTFQQGLAPASGALCPLPHLDC